MTTAQSTGVTLTEAAAQKAKALLAKRVQPIWRCVSLWPQVAVPVYTTSSTSTIVASTAMSPRFSVASSWSSPSVSSVPDGASIDFADTIEQQGFTIDNPNATGSCACGDSFN